MDDYEEVFVADKIARFLRYHRLVLNSRIYLRISSVVKLIWVNYGFFQPFINIF